MPATSIVQHTPGPWEPTPELPFEDAPLTLYAVRGPAGESLAFGVSAEDAHLIAAAPELLAALDELLGDECIAVPVEDCDVASHLQARAAIAKARGEA